MASPAKIAAREEIRRRLSGFSLEARRAASEVILSILGERPEWKSSSMLGLYFSLPDEPETRDLIRSAWAQGKRVALPKTDIRHGLTWWEIQPGTLPTLDTLWEPLPSQHQPVTPEAIDGFCVPGRAFDKQGIRLGRGGGHYDRALGRRSRRSWVTGLFFSLQEMENLPREEHDAHLPQVITEQGWRNLP